MQIIVTPFDGSDPLTLGDDSVGDYIVDPPPLPVERRQAQVEELALADAVFVKSRGNRVATFSWTVSRQHASPAAVAQFVWGHAATVPEDVSVQINQDSASVTFSPAVITEVAIVEVAGLNTQTRYRVTGAV